MHNINIYCLLKELFHLFFWFLYNLQFNHPLLLLIVMGNLMALYVLCLVILLEPAVVVHVVDLLLQLVVSVSAGLSIIVLLAVQFAVTIGINIAVVVVQLLYAVKI